MFTLRIIRLLLALAVLVTAGWLLRGYTTDDTYIHLRYAHNLVERGEFSFNPGASSYGATSPLWIFGLGLLLKVGLSPFLAAWLLGAVSGLAVLLLLDLLLSRLTFPGIWRLFLLLLVVCDPWFLRWTFSGMETPLATFFLLLLLFPLVMDNGYRSGEPTPALWPRYLGWGTVAGLAGLVRPEYMVLAPLALPWLLMFEYHRAGNSGGAEGRFWARPYRPLFMAGLGWLAVFGPWLAYARLTFGRFMPGTAAAKSGALNLNPVDVVANLGQSLKTLAVSQGLLWLVIVALILLVLFVNRGAGPRRPTRWQDWRADSPRGQEPPAKVVHGAGPWSVWGPVTLVLVAATWTLALLGGYAVKQVWIISRYVSPLAPVLLLAMGVVAEWLLGGEQMPRRVRRFGNSVLVTGLVLTLVGNLWVMGAQVVPHARSFPEGVRQCYLGFGEWIRNNTPPGTVVAALDIGAVGYAGDRPVLDLMGLVSPEILAVGQEMGFQEMVDSAAWVSVMESTTGRPAAYFLDRSEGQPRWDGATVQGARFELLDTCVLPGVGLREPQPWTVALYRIVRPGGPDAQPGQSESSVKGSSGG